MKLTELLSATASVAVETPAGELRVRYRPSAYTDEMVSRITSGQITVDQLITEVVESWDLEDDNGNALQISDEVLAQIPVHLKGGISDAILEDLYPNRKPAARSGSFS